MNSVWRVENEEGEGCYIDTDILLDYCHTDENGRPNPRFDKGILRYPKQEELCGFESREQAIEWFDYGLLRVLYREGYRLKKFDNVNITARGQKQILFIKDILDLTSC